MTPFSPFCYTLLLLFLRPPPSAARYFPPAPAPAPSPAISDQGIWRNSAINPWRNFSKFIDLEKGSSVAGISQLKNYFLRFGYLSNDQVSNSTSLDSFDELLESAVFSYQKNLGLPVTGKLDSGTLDQIMSPRCGLSDHQHHRAPSIHTTRRYAYFYGKPRWSKKSSPINLTYAFSPAHTIDYVAADEIRAAFRRSFARWSAVIPVSFIESSEYAAADVKIGFHRGDHGDGESFDGVLGILAHAFSPVNGRLHLDGAERWAVDFAREKSKVAVDLESVATHEIGHVLGLAHSSEKDAVMYPSLSPRTKKTELRIDDVAGVQALYGSNPDFKFSSLLASEETSSAAGVESAVCWGLWMVVVYFVLYL